MEVGRAIRRNAPWIAGAAVVAVVFRLVAGPEGPDRPDPGFNDGPPPAEAPADSAPQVQEP